MNFRHAITRLPAHTFSQGISSANLGQPDINLAIVQHQSYVTGFTKRWSGLFCPAGIPRFPGFCFCGRYGSRHQMILRSFLARVQIRAVVRSTK